MMEIEPFGADTFVIKSVPAFFGAEWDQNPGADEFKFKTDNVFWYRYPYRFLHNPTQNHYQVFLSIVSRISGKAHIRPSVAR